MGVEEQLRGARAQAQRVLEYELKQARFQEEENRENVADLVAVGRLSDVGAQKLMARAKMHGRQDAGIAIDEAVAAGADFKTTEQILEDMLDTESKSVIIQCLLETFGINKLQQLINRERRRRKLATFVHPFPYTNYLVRLTLFDVIVGIAMLINGVLIGFQTSASSADSSPLAFEAMEQVFTAVFVLEVVLRWMADGWSWLFHWDNFGDVSLVLFTSVLPLWVLKPLGVKSSTMRSFSVLRVLRLIRLVRMVRTLKLFRLFWKLICGVFDSGRTLLYTCILIGASLYIAAIFCVYWIGKAPAFKGDAIATEYFGQVPAALFTLFQTVTLDSWSAVARPLMKKSSAVCPILVFVIVIVTMVLFNLVTAIIVNNAFARAKQDDELQAVEKREAMDTEINELRSIFADIDQDGSGTLCKEEYDLAVSTNAQVAKKFQALELAPGETEEIWRLLDLGDGAVHVDRFAAGLRSLQGEAKAKDSFTIVQKLRHINRRMERLGEALEAHQQVAEEVQREALAAQRQLGAALHELGDFLAHTATCLPKAAAATLPELELRRWRTLLQQRARPFL